MSLARAGRTLLTRSVLRVIEMQTETEERTRSGHGLSGPLDWPVGGALGGALGAASFGLLVWAVDPRIVESAVPALYGIEATGVVGWGFHLVNGAVFGLVFAFVVTRPAVLGALRADVETPILASLGLPGRLVCAGFAYGLLIWALLPVLALPIWLETVATDRAELFPALALEGLVGHLLFGVVLGAVFAAVADLSGRRSSDPFAE